jgi:hypothetical protein
MNVAQNGTDGLLRSLDCRTVCWGCGKIASVLSAEGDSKWWRSSMHVDRDEIGYHGCSSVVDVLIIVCLSYFNICTIKDVI